MTRDAAWRLLKITEPGGRFLQINSSSVQAFDGRGNLIETVTYIFQPLTIAGFTGSYLTQVQYDDGPPATFTHQPNNVWQAHYALIETCHDPRYAGVMKDIKYEFVTSAVNPNPVVGQVWKEKNATTTTGQTVSEMIYPGPAPADQLQRREVRGDGGTRLFQYDGWGKLASYSDFEGHVSRIRLESAGFASPHYFKILTDARNYETKIEKDEIAGAVWAVTRGSAPAVTYDYTDVNNPYYLKSKTDENAKTTYYDRNPINGNNANRIWKITYPDDGFETFTYDNNPFGLVHQHRMTSGGTEAFEYDARGLKTSYTPPQTSSDLEQHKTLYFYYGGPIGPGETPEAPVRPDLMDRLRRVIDARGNSTWYEYNARGQVTRVTHPGSSFTQNEYYPDGTLHIASDELGRPTTYTYDEYQRVKTITNAVDKHTTYDYTPVANPSVGPLSHTTSSAYHVTSHMGKVTEYDYDGNFRRTRMTVGLNTDDAATTTFTYDEVGNQETVTEPNGQPGQPPPFKAHIPLPGTTITTVAQA